MNTLDRITQPFVARCREILGGNLTGVYLHGSAAMGCFNEKTSDVDLLVVTRDPVPADVKRAYMDMVVALNSAAPAKGIEMSVVRRAVCRPFVYPTPFELHFSVAHLDWYRADPAGYVERMNGVDRDLAAHFTIIRHRGRRLFGEAIVDVFGEVPRADYVDSLLCDVEGAEEAIAGDPVYVILNLCRVLAFLSNGLILSKREGGEWGLEHASPAHRDLIARALAAYASEPIAPWEDARLREYAADMLGRIRDQLPDRAR